MMRSVCFTMAALILSATAGAQKVRVEYDRSADFARYRTYSWVEPLAEIPPNVALTDLQLFERRLRSSVDKILKVKGLELATGGTAADIELSSQIDLDLRQTTQSLDPGGAESGTKFEPTWVVSRLEGTLYLEIRDTANRKRVWQGTSTAVVDLKKQEDRVRSLTQKMFRNFPPK